MEEYIIRAEQLNKVFPLKKGQTVEALKSLDLTVKQGGLTAIIGPDGAGKTTFMRLVAGLMRPTGGRLTVLGLDSVQGAGEIQTRISYMPQKFGLYEDLTVQENMDLYADLHGVPAQTRPARFDKLLTMMGLERFTGRLAGKLSGGMKQKLGLACTLVRSPELLLLDEPTVGVDPLSRRELWEILKEFVRDENLTVLVNTAYMNEAALCGQVYVLHKGALLAHGTPDDLRAIAAGRCYSCTPPPGEPTRILQAHLIDDTDHVVDAVPKGGDVHFILQEGVASAPYLDAHGIAARPVASDLEDGFMVLLHRAETETPLSRTRRSIGTQTGEKPVRSATSGTARTTCTTRRRAGRRKQAVSSVLKRSLRRLRRKRSGPSAYRTKSPSAILRLRCTSTTPISSRSCFSRAA